MTGFSVFTRNGDVVTVTTPSDCRWLQVELPPHVEGGEEEADEERKRVKVSATGSMVSNLHLIDLYCLFMFLM